MACIESNFFGNTTSLTIVSFTTARASAELPQILHFHTVTTMGNPNGYPNVSLHTILGINFWMLLCAPMCLPGCFTASDMSTPARTPGARSWAETAAGTSLHAFHTPASLTPASANLFYGKLLTRQRSHCLPVTRRLQ